MKQAPHLQDTALRYFHEVVRCGSVSAASLQLHVAASAISRQISGLEAQMGAPLFERKLKPEGSRPLLCRVVWPGIVQVIDLEDGKLLASSTPGNPRELAPDFVPGRTLK